jgi:hypothetical protein
MSKPKLDWAVLQGTATCPQADQHGEPDKGVPYMVWNEKMMKTHRPKQCPGCGLWRIWEPR